MCFQKQPQRDFSLSMHGNVLTQYMHIKRKVFCRRAHNHVEMCVCFLVVRAGVYFIERDAQ